MIIFYGDVSVLILGYNFLYSLLNSKGYWKFKFIIIYLLLLLFIIYLLFIYYYFVMYYIKMSFQMVQD